jgi:hypothetical protein
MVRSRAIWLKSTKMRLRALPSTSSDVVGHPPGSSRRAITACRASMKPYVGSIGEDDPAAAAGLRNPTRPA